MLMLELIISLSRHLRNPSHQLTLDGILNLQSTVKKNDYELSKFRRFEKHYDECMLFKATESESVTDSYQIQIHINIMIFTTYRWLASYIWKANKRQDYGLKFAY
ncbi:hypothetical protein T08_15077 [Trichinella sp. T8]|nr:hypothetical protein T08_15077 [Trichinella sp. T8]